MPLLWRYLLKQLLTTLFLCVGSFVAILLVSRSQEIARFASSGAPIKAILLFSLYQIPTILPLAIPISALISTFLLFQRLSHTQELTAMRACGLSLKTIAYPLLLASFALGIFNFSIASELSPYCRMLTKKLTYKVTESNPLFMLQKGSLVKIKNTFIDMQMMRMGKSAEDLVIITYNNSQERLNILTAKELSIEEEQLKGKNVTLISSVDAKQEGFDHLVIENQETMSTRASNLSEFVHNSSWNTHYDYLPLRMVLAKQAYDKTVPHSRKHKVKNRAEQEICRRISLGLAAFTFSFVGISFGMEIGRRRKKAPIIWASLLAAFFLVSFATAKAWKYNTLAPCVAYLLPHCILFLCSLSAFQRLSKGVE